tara:strand:- start:213 stop:377 length:165 start_codon:yes stop_codon:yes gene_type:complete
MKYNIEHIHQLKDILNTTEDLSKSNWGNDKVWKSNISFIHTELKSIIDDMIKKY